MRLALAGDTMLGRGVAEILRRDPSWALVAPDVAAVLREADLVVVNLECCISERGERFPAPGKPFFFRAPPVAAEVLARMGVGCVTLANNHALDYGPEALLDTLEHLGRAGIAAVGAGADVNAATTPCVLESGGLRLRVVAVTDHPAAYAATPQRPGVAYADLAREGIPEWLTAAARPTPGADATLVAPHWGPNMRSEPAPYVRAAARSLVESGATLVAGHSAHVFHGVAPPVLFDLGDFVDDYRVDDVLRNDLSLLFFVELDPRPRHLEAVPLRLDYGHTRLAPPEDARLIAQRLTARCARLGTAVHAQAGRLIIAAG
jgi:poly-gamma-glutamate capsule biosynthesis protein CapA/YwtB (metallophosphatase superfamily)